MPVSAIAGTYFRQRSTIADEPTSTSRFVLPRSPRKTRASTDTRSRPPAIPALRSHPQPAHTLAPRATCSIVNIVPKQQVARVAVDDEQWLTFRQAALARGVSVSAYLGKLVEAELGRRRQRPVASVKGEAPPERQALDALAEVRASIDELDDIAGRLARSAVAHGASWDDVGTSLRLSAGQASAAFSAE